MKYLQNMHLIKGLYLEYIKNFHNSIKVGKRLEQTGHQRRVTDGQYAQENMLNISHQGNAN